MDVNTKYLPFSGILANTVLTHGKTQINKKTWEFFVSSMNGLMFLLIFP